MLWKASVPTKNEWVKTEIQLPRGFEKGKVREKNANRLTEKELSSCMQFVVI